MTAMPRVFAQQTGQEGAGARIYEKGSVRIRYQEAGPGFPLMLLPGGGLNAIMFVIQFWTQQNSNNGSNCWTYCLASDQCLAPMIPALMLEDKIKTDVAEFFSEELFIRSRIKESLNVAKTEEKALAVVRYEKEIESLEREKARVAVAIRKAPNVDVILAQLQAVDEDIAAVREKLRVSKSELELVLTDGDVSALAARITREFAKFPKLAPTDQKRC
jgi:hypothetical protein